MVNHENSTIFTISQMCEFFDCHVGLHDNAFSIGTAVAAVGNGATSSRSISSSPVPSAGWIVHFQWSLLAELRMLVEDTERAWQSLGGVLYGPGDEGMSLAFRRSVYVAEDMKGLCLHAVEPAMRPEGTWAWTEVFEVLLGKRVNRDVKKERRGWEMVA